MWNPRFSYRPNPYAQQFSRPGGLPWQLGRVPSGIFPGYLTPQPQNVVVGDSVVVGRTPIQQQNQQVQPQPHPQAHHETMRNQQLRYDTLTSQEQQQQDQWALQQIIIGGVCPAGFNWNRSSHLMGYVCGGGNHIITDQNLARGEPIRLRLQKPGFYDGPLVPIHQPSSPDHERYRRDLKEAELEKKKAKARKKKKKKGSFW